MPGARSPLRLLLALPLFSLAPLGLPAQTPAIPPPSADIVEILATTQQKVGDTYLFQGNVEIRYRGMTLTADEVTYNEKTRVAEARGHVVFERDDDHLEATEGRYELATGAGVFQNVEGTAGLPPPPNSNVLVTSNPFYFKADRVERRADGSYLLKRAWVTNCRPGRPKWRMVAARARIQPGDVARLYKTSFLIRGVPVLYSPYAAISIADEPRQSGFLWPTVGNDSLRGTNAGTSYFWAINPHADLHVGAEWFNQGGWTQFADFRALPSASSRMRVTYFGAIAGKLRGTQQRQRNTSPGPMELLLVALGGCSGSDVVSILKKKRQTLTGLFIELSGERAPEPPMVWTKIKIHFRVVGKGIDPRGVEQAIELSRTKYCSVAATLAHTAAIEWSQSVEEA